ncbi:MAG: PQQ-dependent sugar dehydrogenase, partial [Acidobacteriota bacterium]
MPFSRRLTAILIAFVLAPMPLLADPPADLALTPLVNLGDVVDIKNAADGTNRLFLVTQPGTIRIYDLNAGQLLTTPFLDIVSAVDDGGNEQGLLGLAFHPNFSSNGQFFVNYTYDPGPGLDRTRIQRFTVSAGNPNVADGNSALTIIEIEQDFGNHNGGDIKFGPDGYLYMGMGDGGSGSDPNNRSQDPAELLGKMLRLDIDSMPARLPENRVAQRGGALGRCGLVGNYGIPNDNPFVGSLDTCEEIWALGVRNPWRFSFDRLTGDLLIGDVGQNAREEVNFQPASSSGGENYGWDCREGLIAHNNGPSPLCSGSPVLTDPIIDYNHSGGRCSITGGYVYRGAIPSMQGDYIYADLCSSQIWFANADDGWMPLEWGTSQSFITTFG